MHSLLARKTLAPPPGTFTSKERTGGGNGLQLCKASDYSEGRGRTMKKEAENNTPRKLSENMQDSLFSSTRSESGQWWKKEEGAGKRVLRGGHWRGEEGYGKRGVTSKCRQWRVPQKASPRQETILQKRTTLADGQRLEKGGGSGSRDLKGLSGRKSSDCLKHQLERGYHSRKNDRWTAQSPSKGIEKSSQEPEQEKTSLETDGRG